MIFEWSQLNQATTRTSSKSYKTAVKIKGSKMIQLSRLKLKPGAELVIYIALEGGAVLLDSQKAKKKPTDSVDAQ